VGEGGVRYETVTVRHGENVGPVDWEHQIAKDKPDVWRDAEKRPEAFLFNGHMIICLCMYDGWPFWIPRPAICFVGPLKSAEWSFFDSYGVQPHSIERAP
jgi:hypothetical protein